MSNSTINQFPGQNQPLIERRIPKFSPHVTCMEQEAQIKVIVPEYPKREVSSSNLFGRGRKIRGGDQSDSSTTIQKAFCETCIKTKMLEQISHNVTDPSFSSKIFQLVYHCYDYFGPTIIKYIQKANPGFFGIPPAEGFQQNIPRHRPFAERPYQRDFTTPMGKPKMTAEKFNKIVNLPADLLNRKLRVNATFDYGSKLFKVVQETFVDPRHEKQVHALINQARAGNMNPGTGTKVIPGTDLFELRADNGVRIIFRQKDNMIEIAEICDKNNQDKVFKIIRQDSKK